MTSLDVVDTDAFLDMGQGSQLLYFHLNQRADDDGFVSNPKRIMRSIGAMKNDFDILVAKKFLINFEDGVCVIKHWRINNFIRKDIYKPTKYLDLKQTLFIKGNGAYTLSGEEAVPVPEGHFSSEFVNDALTERQPSIGKVRVGKVSKGKDSEVKSIVASTTLSPAEEMRLFLDNELKQKEIVALLVSKGVPEDAANREISKFISYWSELNKSGKKERWELEKTFELRRRLATWFNRIAERQQGNRRPKGLNLND